MSRSYKSYRISLTGLSACIVTAFPYPLVCRYISELFGMSRYEQRQKLVAMQLKLQSAVKKKTVPRF